MYMFNAIVLYNPPPFSHTCFLYVSHSTPRTHPFNEIGVPSLGMQRRLRHLDPIVCAVAARDVRLIVLSQRVQFREDEVQWEFIYTTLPFNELPGRRLSGLHRILPITGAKPKSSRSGGACMATWKSKVPRRSGTPHKRPIKVGGKQHNLARGQIFGTAGATSHC